MAINFYFEKQINLKNRKGLKLFIASIFKREERGLSSLAYIFCSDEYLLKMNMQYLSHDYYTDIISFDLSESKRSPTCGEVYISVERVKENAKINSVPMEDELHRVVFHGALHLCGYKDKTQPQKIQMRGKENYYLKKYFNMVPRGTTD